MVSPDNDPLEIEFEESEEFLVEPSRLTLILWLVTFGLAILFIALYQIYSNFLNDARRLQSEIIPLQQRVLTINTPAADVEALRSRVVEAKRGVVELQAIYPTLAASHYDWSGAMDAAAEYDPSQIVLQEIVQDDDLLLITGKAVNDAAVVNFAQMLAFSGSFADVEIRSMSLSGEPLFSPTPTITPTQTPEPTATPSPVAATGGSGSGGSGGGNQAGSGSVFATSPAPRVDIYEFDDVIPGMIFLGEVQTRNFYPEYDLDTMTLLVKAGRTYKVTTFSLAPGVDTFLEISFADRILVNDDSQPGTLGSEIVFQGGVADTEALIRISNLGLYAPDKIYQISVEEILPTPTATPGVVPTTAPLPTATPTQPPITPSPTPILGDQYEPNDVTPSLIAIGETQAHTFDPSSDVDKVAFVGKRGHQYKIYSNQLGLGVDTFLRVESGTQILENDDLDQPGSGNFASGVCIAPEEDGLLTATFTNLANQYGANRQYTVNVAEVPRLGVEQNSIDFGSHPLGTEGPAAQMLTITSTQMITWSYESAAPWIQVNPMTTSTPSLVEIGILTDTLPIGSHAGEITFFWDDFCQIKTMVHIEIAPLSSDAGRSQTASDGHSSFGDSPGRSPGRMASVRRNYPKQAEVGFVIVAQLNRDLVEKNE